MSRRGSSHNKGITWDQRTGLKVLGRKIKQDGETGAWTTDPDPVHPQRFVRTPGPDGAYWRPGQGRADAIGDKWDIKPMMWSPDTASLMRTPFLSAYAPAPSFDD